MYKLFNNDQQRHRANRIEKAKRDITLLEEELVTVSKNIVQLQQDIQIARKDIKELQHAEELPKRKALLEQKLIIAKQKYLELLEKGESYSIGVDTWVYFIGSIIVLFPFVLLYSASIYNVIYNESLSDEAQFINFDSSNLPSTGFVMVYSLPFAFVLGAFLSFNDDSSKNKVFRRLLPIVVVVVDIIMAYISTKKYLDVRKVLYPELNLPDVTFVDVITDTHFAFIIILGTILYFLLAFAMNKTIIGYNAAKSPLAYQENLAQAEGTINETMQALRNIEIAYKEEIRILEKREADIQADTDKANIQKKDKENKLDYSKRLLNRYEAGATPIDENDLKSMVGEFMKGWFTFLKNHVETQKGLNINIVLETEMEEAKSVSELWQTQRLNELQTEFSL